MSKAMPSRCIGTLIVLGLLCGFSATYGLDYRNRILFLQVYPRLFKFTNGQAALYYKQIGKDIVHAYWNKIEISSKCYKIRYIYTGSFQIYGHWNKCRLPSQNGTFVIKTASGAHRYRNFDSFRA